MIKRLQFTYLLITKILARYLARLRLVVALLLVPLLWLVGSQLSGQFFFSPPLIQGIAGAYTPENLPTSVLNLLSEPLIIIDEAGKPQPHLVASWQVNNNATVYNFKLRDNLRWSDGTVVKSSDIEIKLSGIELSYPDETTLQFKLDDSFSALPSLLTSPVLKKGTLIGAGEYKVLSSRTNHGLITKLDLTRTNPASTLPDLSIRFYPEEATLISAYSLGEINVVLNPSHPESIPLSKSSRVKNIQSRSRLVAIFYNTKDPLLSEKNLRKALTSAAGEIGQSDRAVSSIPPSSWVFNSALKDPLNNQAQAKEYLSRVQNGKNSTVTLTTTPQFTALAEDITRSWKQVGINAEVRIESGSPQNFQSLLTSVPIPSDPDQYALWHSTQAQTNLSKYSSPRADRDLEDARKTTDSNLRKERYLDLQRVLYDDAPATFLYFPKVNIIYRPKVESELNQILPIQF